MHRTSRALWFTLALGLGCAPDDDPRPAAQRTTTRLGAPAGDAAAATDGEPPTAPCAEGDGCDAVNPALADGRRRCDVPLPDCPCAADARPVACDLDTDAPVTPRTCYVGQRDCEAGRWGRCRAYSERFR